MMAAVSFASGIIFNNKGDALGETKFTLMGYVCLACALVVSCNHDLDKKLDKLDATIRATTQPTQVEKGDK
jgi:hypothetical protein